MPPIKKKMVSKSDSNEDASVDDDEVSKKLGF